MIERNPGVYREIYRAVPIGARAGDPYYEDPRPGPQDALAYMASPHYFADLLLAARKILHVAEAIVDCSTVLRKESMTKAATYMVTQASEIASSSCSAEELEMLAPPATYEICGEARRGGEYVPLVMGAPHGHDAPSPDLRRVAGGRYYSGRSRLRGALVRKLVLDETKISAAS